MQIIAALYFGQALLVPLSFALLISFILYPFCRWLESHGFSRALSIAVALFLFFIFSLLLLGILTQQFISFTKQWPSLQAKILVSLNELGSQIDQLLEISTEEKSDLFKTFFADSVQKILHDLPKVLYSISISTVLFILIPIYAALILYYRRIMVKFLYQILPERHQKYISTLLEEAIHAYYNFIKGMAIVYIVVGILNSIGLALLGIPNPIFFGFIASILTFIPYVGITVGAILPMSIAWLTYDSIWYPIGVVAVFVVVQILEANVIFPLAVSFKLKINALVTIIVIVAGGILWGPAGMILFLPFVAIFKLVADKLEELKSWATLIGTN